MSTTLDIILDESILEGDAGCCFADGPAEYRAQMKCCGEGAEVCGSHLARARLKRLPAFAACGHCKTVLPPFAAYDEVVDWWAI